MSALSRGVASRRRLTLIPRGRERRNRKLADQQIAESRDFFQATLDSLVAHVAVLDAHGEIIMTNRAWERFATDNGATASAGEENYLAVSDAAVGEEAAVEASAGLRAIISGRLAEFSLEYPCHSPTLERWYLMHATRYTGPGDARVVVVHVDITRRVVSQRELRSERKAREESVQRGVEELAWIDIEFVSDLASNTASRHVVQAVVALARAFSLQTVGEGVEDAETLTLLRELGVDYAQGYHIARPGPRDS